MGAELCLAPDMGGGVEAYGGAPFGRHAALRLFHFKYWITFPPAL